MKLTDSFLEVLEDLGEDEGFVLEEVAKALLDGQKSYGEFCLDKDTRDFNREAFEEDRDWLVYRAAEVVRNRRR